MEAWGRLQFRRRLASITDCKKGGTGASYPNPDAENVIEYNFFLKWPGFR
jgi:hypothetical protein